MGRNFAGRVLVRWCARRSGRPDRRRTRPARDAPTREGEAQSAGDWPASGTAAPASACDRRLPTGTFQTPSWPASKPCSTRDRSDSQDVQGLRVTPRIGECAPVSRPPFPAPRIRSCGEAFPQRALQRHRTGGFERLRGIEAYRDALGCWPVLDHRLLPIFCAVFLRSSVGGDEQPEHATQKVCKEPSPKARARVAIHVGATHAPAESSANSARVGTGTAASNHHPHP